MKKDYLEIGKIVGAHSIYGDVKVQHWCDSFENFLDVKQILVKSSKNNFKPINVINKKIHKSQILMKIDSVSSRTEAEQFRGIILYAKRSDIPLAEGSYFVDELKGCSVVNADNGGVFGVLKDVVNSGASDIYVVYNSAKNKDFLVPIINNTVEKIDLGNEKIFIRPMSGVFDAD